MAHKTVYLIRHGQTPGNAGKKYIGRQCDEPLSDAGIREAGRSGEFAEMIAKDGGSSLRLCTSPLKRAVQTAEILFGTKEMTRIRDLEEMDFGIFEGKSHSELSGSAAYQAWLGSGCMGPVPGGERREDFIGRSFRGFMTALGDVNLDETVAIVCHGGTIMSVMSRLTGEDYYRFITDNLCGYCLDIETDDEGIRSFSYHSFGGRDPG